MQNWDVIDIKPVISKYTWSNKRIGPKHIAARLDRFLVQSSFLLLGLEARSHILHSSILDHKPISLELLTPKDLRPIPFRFSALWTKEKDFLDKIKECWKKPVSGSTFFAWEEKLRRIKKMLKIELRPCQILQCKGKKSKARKGRNTISEVKDDNLVLKDFGSKAATDHFEQLYREDSGAVFNADLLDAVPNLISSKMNQSLESKITLKEVKEALFSMEPDKALRPDGFTPRFLQVCW
eukprot:PITA_28428